MATDVRSAPAPVHSPDGYANFDEYIDFQLGKTKSNIKWTEIGTAFVWVAIALFGYLLFFAVFDQWIVPGGFGVVPRSVMLVLLTAGTLYAVIRHIAVPGLRRIHGLYAAKVIETADPDLKSALLNFVDLQRAGRPIPESVQRALEKRAAVTLARFDVDQAVDRRPLLRFSYILLAVIVAFGLYSVLSPKDVMTSVKRALLPVSATAAPTQTTIANVTPGDTSLAARSTLVIEADIGGKIPEHVQVLYTTADRRVVDEALEMRPIEEGLPRYRAKVLGENGNGLLQTVTYRIVAGDARTQDYEVRVIQPPSARVDQVAYVYPAYMQRESRTVPGGPIDAWDGTTVTVSATANMPVKTAHVVLLDVEDAHAKGEEIPVTVTEGTKLKTEWKLGFRSDGTVPRFYTIRVRTEKGETDPDPTLYGLNIRADLPPQVALLAPTGDISRPANAAVMLAVQAGDPDFQLRSLTLKAALPGGDKLDVPMFDEQKLGQSFKGTHRFELAPLKLKTGDKLNLWIEARDNRQPTANVASTPRIQVTITDPVTPEQKKQDDQKEEKKAKDAEANADAQDKPREEPRNDQTDKPEPKPDQAEEDRDNPKKPREKNPGQKDERPQDDKDPGEGKPEDDQTGKGEPGDSESQDRPLEDRDADEENLKKLIRETQEQEKKKPRKPRPPEHSSQQDKSPSENKPSEHPEQEPSTTDPQPGENQPGQQKPGANRPGSKKPEKKPGDKRQDNQKQPGENPAHPSPMPSNPGAEEKPGENSDDPQADKSKPKSNGNSENKTSKTEQKQPGTKSPMKDPAEGSKPQSAKPEKEKPTDEGTGQQPEGADKKPGMKSPMKEPSEAGNPQPSDSANPDKEKQPGESPMPGEKQPGGADKKPGAKAPMKEPAEAANPQPSNSTKPDTEKQPGESPMPGEKQPGGADKKPGAKAPMKDPAEGANPQPSDSAKLDKEKRPGESPMPGEKQPGGADKKPGAKSPMGSNPQPSDSATPDQEKKPGETPMPGSRKEPGKSEGKADDMKKSEKSEEPPGSAEEKPKPGEKNTAGTEKPKDMTGAEKPEPGAAPKAGQTKGNEKPGDNPEADKNPDSEGGTPTDTKKPAGDSRKGQEGKPTTEAPKNATDPGRSTEPVPGEEKPAEDDGTARKEKATGDEKGPATGAEKPDPDAVRASNTLEKKPGDKGATQQGKPGDKPKATDPMRNGGTPGGSDGEKQAKPATPQKAPRNDDPKGIESKPDPVKNPDNEREKHAGQPDAGSEDLKGDGPRKNQKSNQPDGGEAGGSKAAEKGNQGSDKKGPGDRDTKPGDADPADKPNGGQSSDQKGPGSKSAPSRTGQPRDEPGSPQAGKPGDKGGDPKAKGGQPSQEKGGQTSKAEGGQPGNQPGSKSEPGGQQASRSGSGLDSDPSKGDRRGNVGGGPNDRKDEPPQDDVERPASDESEEAALQRNRDASNLVLRRLKEDLDRGEPDQELLEKLGWTKEQMQQFVERMEQRVNDTGEDTSPEAVARRKRFEEFLKTLTVGEKTERRKAGNRATRLAPNIQNNTAVPPEYRDQVEAFTRSLAKEKKK